MTHPTMPEIPAEPELPYRLWWTALEHHATALGYICMNFANLEFSVNRFIEEALGCNQDQRRAIVDATGSRLETRCVMLLKLINIRKPTPEFFSDVEATTGFITQEIAPLRNRLVHDVWIQGTTVKQWDQRSKLRQQVAGGEKLITPPAEPERSLESLWMLVSKMQTADAQLTMLTGSYASWLRTGELSAYSELPLRQKNWFA